jgi:multidrug efflux pump subunit AcrA (membrane-fusion protein)
MNMRRIVLILLTLLGIVILVSSCSSKSGSGTTTTRLVTVEKGDISVTIPATGNLALSHSTDLAFDIAGTVESVSVEAGDSVTEGQELVRLDTSGWDKQIKTLEKSLVTAQRNLAAQISNVDKANRNITNKEAAANTAERQVGSKELAVRQAELDLKSAQNNLTLIKEVKEAQDAIDSVKSDYDFAESMRRAALLQTVANLDIDYWTLQASYYKQLIATAEKNLADILAGTSVNVSSNVALQVEKSKLQIEQSQAQLGNARTAVQDANSAVEEAKLAVEDAKTALENTKLDQGDTEQAVVDAQSELDDARKTKTGITAPFDGFIIKVNVAGGDNIAKGAVAMTIAEPDKFEASILVSETDIYNVQLDGDATVSVDALSSALNFPAKVTYIAPTATVSQGVVNYKVTVELQSLQPVLVGQSGSRPSGFSFSGELPSDTKLPDNITVTQGFSFSEDFTPPSDFTPSTTFTPGANRGQFSGQLPGGQSPSNPAVPAIKLKDGLSVTVNIMVQQKKDVLLIPSRAITRKSGENTVQVVKDNVTETRKVTTGIYDETNTEIIEGLSEGEQVAITTSSSSGSNSTNRSPGGAVAVPFVR